MQVALKDLERYLHAENGLPPLIRIALIHAQFETIHPFLDGNGRMGRLLITFWLYYQGILTQPLLYLSNYFKENKDEYYQKLMDVRFEGKWEEWIAFFLQGVIAVSDEAVSSAKSILELKERGQQKLNERVKSNSNYMRMFEYLFSEPITNRADVMALLDVSAPTATNVINVLVQLDILVDITPERKRNKLYSFRDYYEILSKGTEL
jgi:Fic family protein